MRFRTSLTHVAGNREVRVSIPGQKPDRVTYNFYHFLQSLGLNIQKHITRVSSDISPSNTASDAVIWCQQERKIIHNPVNMAVCSFPPCPSCTTTLYRVSQEEWTKLRESVPYVKIYRYNTKHLCPKLNGYGDKGQRKVWPFCGSTYCTWFAWRNTHTLRIVRPCLQLAQARSSLRLHM